MIDIKFIRENPGKMKAACEAKLVSCDVDAILRADEKKRELLTRVEELRSRRNALAKEDVSEGRRIKAELKEREPELEKLTGELDNFLSRLPNIPQEGVPAGDESHNAVVKTKGKIPKFSFEVKDHLDLGEALDVIDVKRASKVAGSRFGYLKGEFALMEFALIQFAMKEAKKAGFLPIVPPTLIRPDITSKLGYWEGDKSEDYYRVSGSDEAAGFYLAGTAEHALVPMHQDEVFELLDLPRRYIGFSSAFRKEAGTYGKDTRGIFRVHQFDKVELVSFTTMENSRREHDTILALEEKLWGALKIPYQVVQLAAGDSSLPASSTIDIEAWFPGQERYREVSSVSNTTDFQARRLNIKYRDKEGKLDFVHILNGTGFAVGRTLAAIAENYQLADGSIAIPKVLRRYVGAKKIERKHGRSEK